MKKRRHELLSLFFRRGLYSADRRGFIYSHYNGKTRRLKSCRHKTGYDQIALSHNYKMWTFQVHQVVWAYFNGRAPIGTEVNHKNFIRHDNRLSNLELVTRSENQQHSVRAGRVRRMSQAKLSESDVIFARELLKHPIRIKEVGMILSVSASTISMISLGKQYKWVK